MTKVVVTLSNLRRVLTHLTDREFAILTKTYVHIPYADDVSILAQLQLSLGDWIKHLGNYLSDHQLIRVLVQFKTDLTQFAGWLEAFLDHGKKPISLRRVCTLTISDGRWVHTNWSSQWYDAEAETLLNSLPEPCVTHITCDLTCLYARLLRRLRTNGGTTKDDDSKQNS